MKPFTNTNLLDLLESFEEANGNYLESAVVAVMSYLIAVAIDHPHQTTQYQADMFQEFTYRRTNEIVDLLIHSDQVILVIELKNANKKKINTDKYENQLARYLAETLRFPGNLPVIGMLSNLRETYFYYCDKFLVECEKTASYKMLDEKNWHTFNMQEIESFMATLIYFMYDPHFVNTIKRNPNNLPKID